MELNYDSIFGKISVSPHLVAEISGAVAESCYGVVGMASRSTKDGIVSLLQPDNRSRGVRVTIEDNMPVVELHIIVEFGLNIKSICKSIAGRVRYTLESVTGVSVKCVNIRVEGIRVSE